ncbi:hypothetical protein [Imbroritus primus]|uniref:hypothetical protein n=1 Tax=Imbroritus primus TaxID=3058603 RepID=UPI003D160F6D
MKSAALLLLTTVLSAVLQISPSHACSMVEPKLRPNVRYYPIVGDSTRHWPAETTAQIGSITSLLVPADAQVEVKAIKQGMMAPLTIFGEASHEQMRASRDLAPRWVDLPYDPKKFRWVHIYASSFGESEIRMSSPSGWTQNMKVTLVYPSPTEQVTRSPVTLTLGTETAATPETAHVDARDNIEVIAPGLVGDGWTVSPEEPGRFKLIRVLQVQKTDGEPQVRLFFAGTSSPRSETVTIRRGGTLTGTSFRFRIEARPTPAC